MESHDLSKGAEMKRLNVEPLYTFPDGSFLVLSTHRSKEGDFSCTLYNALATADDAAVFKVISSHLQAATCLLAQEHAYEHAMHLYPRVAQSMKRPPYLIWHGPQSRDS